MAEYPLLDLININQYFLIKQKEKLKIITDKILNCLVIKISLILHTFSLCFI